MSELWARAALKAYRYVGSAIYPFAGAMLLWRARSGKEDLNRRGERYGKSEIARPDGPLIWLHAASVGESKAILPLIARLEDCGINIVLTTGTVTSAALAEEQISSRTIHQYVPFDMKPAVQRFLKYWHPDLAIFAESEIWPMSIMELGSMGIPQVLVNARLSDRSFRRWRQYGSLAAALFENLSHVVAQSELDASRFEQLGVSRVTVSGNLKVDVAFPAVDPQVLDTIQAEIGGRPTWMALSTHPGEEEKIVAAQKLIKASVPGVLTLIVPRHPNRADGIETMLTRAGLKVARRGMGHKITPDTDVYLGDTMGEMGLYLGLGSVAFLGKSLSNSGGQNPLEPAMMEVAILSGRNVQNFRATFEALLEDGAARLVSDEKMLAAHVSYLLTNPEARVAMTDAAKATVDKMRGSLERTFQALDPYVTPLQMKASLTRPPVDIALHDGDNSARMQNRGQSTINE